MYSVSSKRNRVVAEAKRYTKARSGSVGILFGLMIMSIFLAAGGAVDMSRWLHARNATVGAVDAAVLAGARHLQVHGDYVEAANQAQRYYEANVVNRPELLADTINFTVVDTGTALTAEGEAVLETTFLKLAGINSLPLLSLSGSEFSKALLAVNGNAEFSLEVSMMLDVTGSMSGDKLAAMKEAAKDLVNIVVWEDGGTYTSRVALVPFSKAVNIGTLSSSILKGNKTYKTKNNANGQSVQWKRAPTCAAERTGTNAFVDVAPTGSNRLTTVYNTNGVCSPSNPVVPLTSDKTLLKTTIDSFQATGTTAGHLGTGWAWYTLSPNWNSVFPIASQPKPYSLLSQLNSKGKPVLEKIAVLMTDGEYNTQYCNSGVLDKNSLGSASYKGNCTASGGDSATQARALCTGMKDQGITVYSVGFQLASGGTAEETLAQCASSEEHVYNAQNAEELKQSFRNIALKISALYLSK
jgi:Flp pilus assembly protein TadG